MPCMDGGMDTVETNRALADTLIGIENVTTRAGNAALAGNGFANGLDGGAGNDSLTEPGQTALCSAAARML